MGIDSLRPLIAVVVCLAAGLVGCKSEPPFVDNSADPISFARDIKETVLNHAALARTSSEPADSVSLIVESVSNLDGSPTGDHRATYEKILSTSKELLSQCSAAKGKPAGLDAKLDALIKLAESLPGAVKLEKRRGD